MVEANANDIFEPHSHDLRPTTRRVRRERGP